MRYASVIEDTVAKYLQRHNSWMDSPEDINNGHCDIFAAQLVKALGRGRVVASWYDQRPDNPLRRVSYWEDHPLASLLIQHKARIMGEGHAWVFIGSKHYDAEAPSGVDNPLDLPFYKRVIGYIQRSETKDQTA